MTSGGACDPAAPGREGLGLLLSRLDADLDRAGAAFERLRGALIKFFDWRGASWPDECADETIDRLIRKLEEGVAVLDVVGFAHGIARNVLHESARLDARRAPLGDDSQLETTLSGDSGRDTFDEADETLSRRLDRCLEQLEAGGRDLVLAYYASASGRSKIESRRRLARDLRLSDNALRSRMQRLRDRLEDCVRRGEEERAPRR